MSASASATGFIGVGNIGFWMARRLIEGGHRLIVNDRNEPRARELVGAEGTVAASARDVADGADVIFLSLPTPDALRDVVGGEHGIVHGKTVRLVVDLSTVGPDAAVQASETLRAAGIAYLDAPVSGGVPGAQKGTLAIMVAGSHEDQETVQARLELIGRPIRVGDAPGRGQALKLLNNFLSATAMAATAEAIALGQRAGLDPAVMLEVFNASSGRNTATSDKFPSSVLTRRFDYGFRTVLFHKDVRLCRDFAAGFGASMPVIEAVDHTWKDAADVLGDGDFTRIAELAERRLQDAASGGAEDKSGKA